MTNKPKHSLGKKTTIAGVCLSILLAGVSILLAYKTYASNADEHYKRDAYNTANIAVSMIDGDRIATYLDTLQTDDEYWNTLNMLYLIKENTGITYLYVLKSDMENTYFIMDADEEGFRLGDVVSTDEEFRQYIDKMADGMPPTITRSEFGWLVTTYEPVFDSNNQVAAMVGVDISMDEIMADRMRFLLIYISGVSLAACAFISVVLWLLKRYVVWPINRLAFAAADFVSRRSEDMEPFLGISELDIHTGDEIENLSDSIKSMEQDIFAYINYLTTVTAEKERIATELNVASQIQASMLPRVFPESGAFDVYASMNPARAVGGDFYDFFMIDNRRLGFVIADVSDKGVPAGLFMVVAKTLIKNQAAFYNSPAELFAAVNAQLCENNDADMFVTAFMGVLYIDTGRLVFTNAGHNPPLVCKKGQGFDWLNSRPNLILAAMPEAVYKNGEFMMEPGDRMFLYTDGVTEATNLQTEMFGDDRLLELLNGAGVADMSLKSLVSYVKDEVNAFENGADQADDITMLALEFAAYQSD